jgi:hypothetical protein
MSNEVVKVKSVEELLLFNTKRSDDEVKRLVYKAALLFHGDINDLIVAVGCLYVGRLLGWRVIRLVYSNKRYSDFQKILSLGMDNGDFKFADWFEDRERLSYKSYGLWLVDKAQSFWDTVRGVKPLPLVERRLLDETVVDR